MSDGIGAVVFIVNRLLNNRTVLPKNEPRSIGDLEIRVNISMKRDQSVGQKKLATTVGRIRRDGNMKGGGTELKEERDVLRGSGRC